MEFSIFQVGISLLAFIIAFYALTAREGRTPLIVNSAYSAFYIVFISVALAAVGGLVEPVPPIDTRSDEWLSGIAGVLHWLSVGILTIGLLYIFDRIWRVHNQQKNLRTDSRLKHISLVRRIRFWWQHSGTRKKEYTHNPAEFSAELLKAIRECSFLPAFELDRAIDRAKYKDDAAHSLSAAFEVQSFSQADEISTQLAYAFLTNGATVQYVSCARHPIEFWWALKRHCEKKGDIWAQLLARIALIDGYTPHYGFTDSIHAELTLQLEESGARLITSAASYAGLHTASMQAFKGTKKIEQGVVRSPTLVIYEGVHALVELESLQQYRIFMRHMIPSERLWGGMFTLIIESSIEKSDISIVKSYADVFVSFQETPFDSTEASGTAVKRGTAHG